MAGPSLARPLSQTLLVILCLSVCISALDDGSSDVTNPEVLPMLEPRQNSRCPSGYGYFTGCGGCCPDTGPAGCYAPLQGPNAGRFNCYPYPPGRIVSTRPGTTIYDTMTSTAATSVQQPAPTLSSPPPAITNVPSLNPPSTSTCLNAGYTFCANKAFCCPAGDYCFYDTALRSRCAFAGRTTITSRSYLGTNTYTASTTLDFASAAAQGIVPTMPSLSFSLAPATTRSTFTAASTYLPSAGGADDTVAPATGTSVSGSRSAGQILQVPVWAARVFQFAGILLAF